MDKRTTFNRIISDYAISRPGYPMTLYNDIIEFSMLKPNGKILEIGSGTGQGTEYFVKNEYNITALELGDKQTQYLSEKYCQYNNFSSVCSPFEEFDCLSESFDLVFSATAFHWIKADIGYPKAYNILKSNGTLAVFWHMSPIIKHQTEMFIDIRNIYHKYAPELDTSKNTDEIEFIHNLRISEMQTNNLFGMPNFKIYRWNDEYTTKKYIKLLNTYSSFQIIDKDRKNIILKNVAELIDSKNGKILVPQEVRLYMAKKVM